MGRLRQPDALVTGALLFLARLLRLGFLGDFLSASVLIGFLTGVGVQVLSGQIPDMLGVPKGSGNWFEQQWAWISELGRSSGRHSPSAAATMVDHPRLQPVAPARARARWSLSSC